MGSFSLTHLEHNQLWVLIQNMYMSLCARGDRGGGYSEMEEEGTKM